jgi:glutaredoxin
MAKKEVNKHAIDSIYSIEENEKHTGLIIGIVLTIVAIIGLIVLAALSMKSGAVDAASKASENYNVSILGNFNAKTVSLPILSIVLGLVDGFNPCAMWILVFLILMLIEMKDRKKMWILGSAFLLTSALIYLIFMVSWLNIAVVLSGIKFVRIAIGVFALIFGIVNVIRFFKLLHDDVGCDVTNEKRRSKIMMAIRKIVSEKSFGLALIGIIVLAAGVNLLELLCSLGIPVVFTQVLAINNLNVVQYMIYILLYLIFFMIDDFIVFIIAMTTLKVTGISNRYTKWSHLIGGIFMALLGVLMLFKPAWIMFNFSDNSSVKALSYGDFYKETNIEDIKFDDKVNIYIFRGEGCPHCRDLTNLITEYINEHPFDYNVYEFEVWNNKDNSKLMMSIAELVGNKDDATGVPYLLVGRHSMIGYADYNADKVKEMLKVERETKASERIDYMRDYLSNKDSGEKTTTSTTTIAVPNTTKKKK